MNVDSMMQTELTVCLFFHIDCFLFFFFLPELMFYLVFCCLCFWLLFLLNLFMSRVGRPCQICRERVRISILLFYFVIFMIH